MKPGIYIHVPFCVTKCTYCNFNFVINYPKSLPHRYHSALLKEIERFKHDGPNEVDSIYFGGGTPSIVPFEYIEKVIDRCRQRFELSEDSEITLEINPDTLTEEKALAYQRMGVNRASLGVQAFNDAELRSIGRTHTARRAVEAYELLRGHGFGNVSIDLMVGLPKQTSVSWANNLEQIRRLQPDHVSVYMLELDGATKLGSDFQRGKIKLPEDEFVTDCYSRTIDFLSSEGYEHYEISNFARPGYASRHNLKYWLDVPYYGFGAGSHSYFNNHRYSNERDLEKYIRSIAERGDAVVEATKITTSMRIEEGLFLGLRKISGIDLSDFNRKYNTDVLTLYKDIIERMLDAGLLELSGDHMKLTRTGLALSNEVFQEFIAPTASIQRRASSP